jgi:hypothetical protein
MARTRICVFITSIRVAESETDVLYDTGREGSMGHAGVLFATGKSELQPVAARPQGDRRDHEARRLKILIEGHTTMSASRPATCR